MANESKLKQNNVEIATISDAQIITNKDIDGGTASNSNRVTVPKNTTTNLNALTRKEGTIVYDTDIDALKYDNGTVLQEIGSGSSGAADLNNQITGDSVNAESSVGSWVTYADAAASIPVDGTGGSPNVTLTRTTTTADVLNGTASFLFTKDAANRQGEGTSLSLTVDRAIQGKPCVIKFNYQYSASFVNGTSVVNSDIMVYVYDVTNATLITPYPAWLDGSGLAEISFQAPTNSTSLRLILHVATTNASAYTFGFDNVFLGLNDPSFIPLSSDFKDAGTVTFQATTTSPTKGTATIVRDKIWYRRDGQFAEVRFEYNHSTAGTATAGSGTYLVLMPDGLQIDLDYVTVNTDTNNSGAHSHSLGLVAGSLSAASALTMHVEAYSATQVRFVGFLGGAINIWQSGSLGFNNANLKIGGFFRVPIKGWTSGFKSSDVVAQNIPVIFKAFKNGGSAAINTTISTWTGIRIDTVGGFDASTGVYTVKVPGTYRGLFKFKTTGGSGNIEIRKNGTTVDVGLNSGSSAILTCLLENLIVGDQITVTTSAATNFATTNVDTAFELEKIETPQASLSTKKIAILTDEKAANTSGGTFTSGAFQTRTLNTKVDPFGIATLTANQFVLQPGTYKIEAYAIGYNTNRHKAKIRNITASTDTLIGSSEFNSSASAYAQTQSFISGVFSITTASTFELQHRCETTRATFGFGNESNFGVVEVYAAVEIEKIL